MATLKEEEPSKTFSIGVFVDNCAKIVTSEEYLSFETSLDELSHHIDGSFESTSVFKQAAAI